MEYMSQRILLRPFRMSDLEDLFEYSSQSGVGEAAGWKPHATIEESRLVLTRNIADPDIYAIELRENQKVIGHMAVHLDSEEGRPDTKELGFVLHRDYQRRGIMAEAVTLTLQVLHTQGVKHVYACCFQDNLPSKCLIERCGFTFEREGTYVSSSLNKTFPSYEYVYHING